MARLIGPSEGTRLVVGVDGSYVTSRAGSTVPMYTDTALTTLGDVRVRNSDGTVGSAYSGSAVPVDALTSLPDFWFPDGVDVLYYRRADGTPGRVDAREDERLDALGAHIAQGTGIDPTGVADSRAALQAKLDAQLYVYVPPGTYRLTSGLSLRSGQRLHMAPTATLVADGLAAASAVLLIDNASNVTVVGGILDGQKAVYPTGGYFGVKVMNDSRVVDIRETVAKNFPGTTAGGDNGGDGFYVGIVNGGLVAPYDVTFTNCVADGNVRQGCTPVAGTRIKFVGCSFINTTGNAPGCGLDIEPNVSVPGLRDVIVDGCTFDSNNGGGISVDDDTAGPVLITNCTFRNNGSPSNVAGSAITIKGDGVTIVGNGVDWTVGRPAIVVRGRDITITGNELVGGPSSGDGIVVADGEGVSIVGNTVRCGGNGIHLEERFLGVVAITNVAVTGNVLVDCGGTIGAGKGGIVGKSTAPLTIQQVVLSGNVIVDTRSGAARADFGIRADVTAGELASWIVTGNRVTGQNSVLSGVTERFETAASKDVANGYAGLDASALIPDARIPSSITRDTELAVATGGLNLRPAVALAEVYPRINGLRNQATLSSGRMQLVAIYLPSGTTVTSITFVSGSTAMVTGSNQWFGLFNSSRQRLATTNDDTSTAWPAGFPKPLALSAPFVTTYSGLHYLGIVVVATTVPSLAGNDVVASAMLTASPAIAGSADTGLTNPASCPATLAVIAANGTIPYAYVS